MGGIEKTNSLIIKDAIILTLINHPKKEIRLQEIYQGIQNVFGREILDSSVRGVLYGMLKKQQKASKDQPQLVRISKGNYSIKIK
jgi:hypothetical protein